MVVGFSLFFYLAQNVFSEDKRLFIMDLNLAILKSSTTEIKYGLKSRIDALQRIIPKVYSQDPSITASDKTLFSESHVPLQEELLGIQFYQVNESTGKYEQSRNYQNKELYEKMGLREEFPAELEEKVPLHINEFSKEELSGIRLINRSVSLGKDNNISETPVLTILFGTETISNSSTSKGMIVAVDLVQDFLQKVLGQSEFADIFLISKQGMLISHHSLNDLVQSTGKPLTHPIVAKLQSKQFPRESIQAQIGNEIYLCNVSETAFSDVFAVSQIKQSEAFSALKELRSQTLIYGVFVLSFALIFSVLFASRLTHNIRKLGEASKEIASGKLDITLDIRSSDEVSQVADSFLIMSKKISALLVESVQRAKLEKELETASLIQSTVLTPPEINHPSVDLAAYYGPSSECGGDYWDAFIINDKLTVIIGDATGHGAPAAIVTAVAKSCFSTLRLLFVKEPLAPNYILTCLNNIIYSSCRGKLLMTMCVFQLNLKTGEVTVCNAGHYAPYWIQSSDKAEASNHRSIKNLYARADILGVDPHTQYKVAQYQLKKNDTIVLLTDGVLESKNNTHNEWGENHFKKALYKYAAKSTAAIRDGLIHELKRFSEGVSQPDDITFTVLRWKGNTEVKAEPPKTDTKPLAAA